MQVTLPKSVESVIERGKARSGDLAAALFERPESLSALLPYDEYLERFGMFTLKDGSLGAVFEADLLEHEPMVSEEIVAAVDALKSWFNLPTNCTLQILFDQGFVAARDSCFPQFIDRYPEPHPVSKALLEARVNQIRGACNSSQPMAPFTRRCLISLRYYPGNSERFQIKKALKASETVLADEMKQAAMGCRAFSQILANFERNSKIPLKALNAADLLDFLRRFFNPKTYYKRSFARFNPNLPISDQILYQAPTLDYVGIEREGVKTRTLTLKTSPQYAYPGGMANFLKLSFPFKLSLNFRFPTKRQVKTFFDLKEFFLQNSPSAKAKRQQEEILEVQNRLAREDRCLYLTFNVVIEGETDEELDARVREVVNVFHNDLECETILEDKVGLGLCLNSLPLMYGPKADASAGRFIRILRSDATKFIPVFDSFRGLKNPLAVHLSRENALVRFSLLENETSNHTVVLADSGSGKSAFVIDCVQAAKRMSPEPLIFVIDKKSSYIMLSEYFDGDLTVFERGRDMPFTPFRGIYDDDKIAFLTRLLVSGIQMTSPTFEVDSTHTTALSRALRLAYLKKSKQAGLTYLDGKLLKKGIEQEAELNMEDLIAELAALTSEKDFESFGPVVEALVQRLKPFYGDGVYAAYFKGSANPKTDKGKSFYIYDLDALDSDATLQALMTMAVTEEIRRIMKLPENQGRTGFIIFEELGMLGRNNPTASQFIIDLAETGRKLGFWLIGLTPRTENYFQIEAGRAMWSVADNFLFLQMSADNVEYLAKHSTLLDPANTEIIKSLRTKKGQYAEVFYMNKKKSRQGAFRYCQTPLDRWLAPTNAKDAREAAKALKKFGVHKWQALEYLAAKFPQGVEIFESEQAEAGSAIK